MVLLTDELFEIENSKRLMDLLYNNSINGSKTNNFSFSFLIEYEEFKNIIHSFILDIMRIFINNTNYKEDNYFVSFEQLPTKLKGRFIPINNILIINEQVIKNIYNGDIDGFVTIFHELSHFKIEYEIKSGIINSDICNIVKERLIREACSDPLDEIGSIKSIKNGFKYVNDNYYQDNYLYYTEELVARREANRNYACLIKKLLTLYAKDQEAANKEFNEIEKEIIGNENIKNVNSIRDFNSSFFFNDYYLDYHEAFELLLKDNPKWLEYPQISIEYFIDENNVINKKSVEQLIEMLNESNNQQTREYIKELIANIELAKNNVK